MLHSSRFVLVDRLAHIRGYSHSDEAVREGASAVDESMLTGESLPVEKHPEAAMAFSSVSVATNSLRLCRFRTQVPEQ
jgi:cation transport ATPase